MYAAPSRAQLDSYAQDSFSPSSGASFSSSNNRHPFSLPSLNYEDSDSFYGHQISAERHCTEASSSSLAIPHSAFHNSSPEAPRDPQHAKEDATATGGNYLQRRDTFEAFNYQFQGQGLPEQVPSSKARSEHSGDTAELLSAGQKRKSRREKPRIDLAPDQPPTTQGKPRARVYVACVQCRARKIRCDGAKPACHNCSKRATGSGECNYDPIPKRRGPDKTPGARQRGAKDAKEDGEVGPVRRRRRRDPPTTAQRTATPENLSPPESRHSSRGASDIIGVPGPFALPSPVESDILNTPVDFAPLYGTKPPEVYSGSNLLPLDDMSVTSLFVDKVPTAYNTSFDLTAIIPVDRFSRVEAGHGYITSLDESNSEEEDCSGVSREPSVNFNRKIWWESLLSLYMSPDSSCRQSLTATQRASAAHGITSDIRFLFSTSNYWFSFFHVPTFNSNYFDPVRRERMQPCLVLALLAMSTFWQSSEIGNGRAGRERALRFRDEAQSALDASFNAGWIDETLAQAAWLLALFEVCAHPLHSSERSNSSMIMLDSIIRSLSLTFVDADDPKTTTFSPGAVPSVLNPSRNNPLFSDEDFNPHMPSSPTRVLREPVSDTGCACRSMTLITHWQESGDQTPLWTLTPAWNNTWNEADIRKESCRRLCWSSIILAAGHVSYTTAHRFGALNLFISDPSNVGCLWLYPSFDSLNVLKSIAYSPTLSSHHSSKDTIWALHDRSFLLWHSCTRMRSDMRASDDAKAHFAVKTWLEADALEAALNKHTCRIERQFIFQAREYIFK
ncbi:hypothetical protein H0H87_005030 [Tephrocybe sp. NHM501043]|nr:hypothetical protein H0H87_005030 [Tephrocybe sp. NHM501043]